MKLVVATSNPHKVQEFSEILAPHGVEIFRLDEVETSLQEPQEDAETFLGNARIKAVSYARVLGRPCLADDSGLEVDGLGGAPGVRSARYAGSQGSRDERDRANNEKLIAELEARGIEDRRARLVCALCLANASGEILFEARGTIEGTIVNEGRGGHGFGYDTHLYLPEIGKTAAELSPSERNVRSHRAQATRSLLAWLESEGRVR